MNSDDTTPNELDPELAARMERLAARRAKPTTASTPEPFTDAIDPELAARMERLAARRDGAQPPVAAPAIGADDSHSKAARSSPKKRRHPAKGSRIASLALSLLTTVGLTGYMVIDSAPSLATSTGGIVSAVATAPPPNTTPPLALAVPATTSSATTTTAPATDAIVNGDVFNNKWGNVQVQATFSPEGMLADVSVLQVPFRDRESVQINDYAVPRLNSEALTAQSANVNTVSGATYTSRDYERSLQSAIDIARSNSITKLA